jgi:hypothetical protein
MIIGIVSDHAIGGTFLSWSLHYLAGHRTYFSTVKKEYNKLPDNPLTDINAHIFDNQVETLTQFTEYIDLITEIPTNLFHSVYFHNLNNGTVATSSICIDTTKAIDQLQTITENVILLYNQPSRALYYSKFQCRDLSVKMNKIDEVNNNFNDHHNDFIDTFFNESKTAWEQSGLTNTWDYREFLALNLRPYDVISIVPNFNFTKKHYPLDCFELFNNFDKTVISLFDFLELKIDSSRWNNWLTVYNQWKELHTDRILFVDYFDQIIDAILNNYYMELSRFNLDIVQEAAIQHVLLYKHGLTFRARGLEKFNNTQDLHLLLEPNIYHDVKDYL